MEITIKVEAMNELQKELIALFDNLDVEGQAEVIATAYKENMRMKGINPYEEDT